MQQHILLIEDISLVGRCSLTAALPLLSACGIRVTMLPTALLSSHTGGFGTPHRLDLSEHMAGILAHWQEIPLRFDAVHVGYLAGSHQLPQVMEAVRRYRQPGTRLFVDPVMGDWGRRYSFCDEKLIEGFTALAQGADLLLPNRTEAALLLHQPYEKGADSPEKLLHQLHALLKLGSQAAVITGISCGDGYIGAAALSDAGSLPTVSLAREGEGSWPGTGDLFASVVEAALLQGKTLKAGCDLAVRFVSRCIAHADAAPKQARFGLPFEQELHWLAQELKATASEAGT